MSESTLGMLSAAVTDLAARLEELDARICGDGDESAPQLAHQLANRVAAVEGVLAEVRKTVTRLAQNAAADQAQVQQRQPWDTLTAEQAEKRWIDLHDWVDWFVVRDNIGTKEIPDCWYVHGGLVDELEALRWAWIETTKPESKMTDPIWWRDTLHRARTRWQSFNPNGCTTSHTETRPRVPGGAREWFDFLAEELADRPRDRQPSSG